MEIRKRSLFLVIIGVSFVFLLAGCIQQLPKETAAAPPVVEKKVEEKREVTKPTNFYTEKLKPLTPAECGRCHSFLYGLLQKEGAKHKGVLCTQCHKQFHVYNPVKQNWTEIMPKCERCHGVFHGEKLAKCSICHIEPHAPLRIPMSAFLENNCATCHSKEAKEVNQFLSKHTEIGCSACHEKHGYIPSCMDCHEPHTATLTTNKQCLACHPVHSPTRRLKYALDTPNEICAACHGEIADTLAHNKSKHHDVACVRCHGKHKYIPKCEMCHGQPHTKALLMKFPNCLECHIDPHNLPTKVVAK